MCSRAHPSCSLDALMHFYLYSYFLDAFMDAVNEAIACYVLLTES